MFTVIGVIQGAREKVGGLRNGVSDQGETFDRGVD